MDGDGEHPASWRDLEAYERATGCPMTRWERQVFRRLDNAYFASKVKPNG